MVGGLVAGLVQGRAKKCSSVGGRGKIMKRTPRRMKLEGLRAAPSTRQRRRQCPTQYTETAPFRIPTWEGNSPSKGGQVRAIGEPGGGEGKQANRNLWPTYNADWPADHAPSSHARIAVLL